jgi:hypothetical protein
MIDHRDMSNATQIMNNDDAHRAADDLATAVWDFLCIPVDHLPGDTADLRQAAVGCLFASKKLNTRSRTVTAARTLALAVIAYTDHPSPETYRDLSRWSRKYEELRLR